jgi:hypothetical protein
MRWGCENNGEEGADRRESKPSAPDLLLFPLLASLSNVHITTVSGHQRHGRYLFDPHLQWQSQDITNPFPTLHIVTTSPEVYQLGTSLTLIHPRDNAPL